MFSNCFVALVVCVCVLLHYGNMGNRSTKEKSEDDKNKQVVGFVAKGWRQIL